MKKILVYISVVVLAGSTFSCKKFLQEHPTGFLTTGQYYTTAEQVEAAVNGAYTGLNSLFSTGIGVAEVNIFPLEYINGYVTRPRIGGGDDEQFLLMDNLNNQNGYLEDFWTSTFYPLENCNSVIANLEKTTVISDADRQKYQGEVSFLRAWYYFQAVKLFGDIPLKTKPTTDLSDVKIGKNPTADIYTQIVADLQSAEGSGLPWTDVSGRVTMGAIKSLLAKVYLTMAGYPLNMGGAYYQKAYDKSLEVINSGQFSLFNSYADLRDPAKNNSGEHILMIQHNENNIQNVMHFSLMPYPEVPVSVIYNQGGGLSTSQAFYNSFASNDLRKQEKQFFYTQMTSVNDPSTTITLPTPYIYKYWDAQAEIDKKSGANFELIRYADVLLVCAEARTMLDGGTTTDVAAINAWYRVHHRAFPAAVQPASLSFDEVYKERYWELCFEFQTWYDMQRTRKAFDVTSGQIVDLIGYTAPSHVRAFKESDLLFPIPYTELTKDPNLQ